MESNDAGLSGEVVRYCAGDDPKCMSPLAQGVAGAEGLITLPPVPIGTGNTQPATGSFFEVFTPDAGLDAGITAIIPLSFFFGYPPSQASWSQVALNDSNLAFVTGSLLTVPPSQSELFGGLPQDAGVVAAIVVDCNAGFLDPADVEISLSTMPGATPVLSFANVTVFTGVANGLLTVTATPKSLGSPSSVIPVFVQPGRITGVVLAPSPLPSH